MNSSEFAPQNLVDRS